VAGIILNRTNSATCLKMHCLRNMGLKGAERLICANRLSYRRHYTATIPTAFFFSFSTIFNNMEDVRTSEMETIMSTGPTYYKVLKLR
jgi:hypothetical protein